VTLHANSFAGALYNNKFESSEIPTRTGTNRVNCSVYCRSNDDQNRSLQISAKNQQWRCGASRSRIAADRLFSAHFQSFVVTKCKTKMVLA